MYTLEECEKNLHLRLVSRNLWGGGAGRQVGSMVFETSIRNGSHVLGIGGGEEEVGQ